MSDSEIYRRVYVKMWADAKVRALSPPPPSGLVLWLHLICGEQTGVIPGLFRIGERAFAEQLGWPLDPDLFVGSQSGSQGFSQSLSQTGRQSPSLPRCFREAYQEVEAQGLVKADWDARLVWVKNGISYNPPTSLNVVKSWKKPWSALPECDLKTEARQHLKAYVDAMGDAFALAFDEACPLPSGMPKPLPRAFQEAGNRKQVTGERESRARVRQATVTTSDDLIEHTVSTADAQTLVDHWQAARFKRGEAQTIIVPETWRADAKLVIAMAGGDLDKAKLVVDAYVASNHKFWKEKHWLLSVLAQPRDFEQALMSLGASDKTKPKRSKMEAYEENLRREMAEIDAANRAEAERERKAGVA